MPYVRSSIYVDLQRAKVSIGMPGILDTPEAAGESGQIVFSKLCGDASVRLKKFSMLAVLGYRLNTC